MAKTTKSCELDQENDCSCKDTIEIFKISDFFKTESYSFTKTNPLSLSSISLNGIIERRIFPTNFNKEIFQYTPPLVIKDIQLLDEIFLI